MDISKFNQELAHKVAKANGLEKHQRMEEAITVWIEITEMVISMSKLPKIDFAFRSMLIEKTKQIIKHIKELKNRSAPTIQKQRQKPVLKPKSPSTNKEIGGKSAAKNLSSKSESLPSIQEQKRPKISRIKEEDIKFVKSVDIKNLPKGFKEIETSEDFTIITPHDKKYVEKILSQDIDMSIFKPSEPNEKSKSKEIPKKNTLKGDILICFACGEDLPAGTKTCPNCGTKLK